MGVGGSPCPWKAVRRGRLKGGRSVPISSSELTASRVESLGVAGPQFKTLPRAGPGAYLSSGFTFTIHCSKRRDACRMDTEGDCGIEEESHLGARERPS